MQGDSVLVRDSESRVIRGSSYRDLTVYIIEAKNPGRLCFRFTR